MLRNLEIKKKNQLTSSFCVIIVFYNPHIHIHTSIPTHIHLFLGRYVIYCSVHYLHCMPVTSR